jgi:hypothetical protein
LALRAVTEFADTAISIPSWLTCCGTRGELWLVTALVSADLSGSNALITSAANAHSIEAEATPKMERGRATVGGRLRSGISVMRCLAPMLGPSPCGFAPTNHDVHRVRLLSEVYPKRSRVNRGGAKLGNAVRGISSKNAVATVISDDPA